MTRRAQIPPLAGYILVTVPPSTSSFQCRRAIPPCPASGRLVGRVGADWGVVILARRGDVAGGAAVAEVLLSEGGEALLLGDGVDVRADDEGDEVEEGHPELVGEELLRKGQADGRGDPGHAHDLPEADADCCPDLVIGAGAGDEGHGNEVDAVLDGSDLWYCQR